MSNLIKIAPSVLSANFAALGQEVKQLTQAGADWIHLDVMDGHFVPNLTFGPPIVRDLRPLSSLCFDVHLMTYHVDLWIDAFAEAGVNRITVHPESGPHLHRSLQKIRDLKLKAGIAINPGTSLECLNHIMDDIDQILIMTVNPGFGGQAFLTTQLGKIESARKMVGSRNIDIVVDGGVNVDTAPHIVRAGANVLVTGAAIFKDQNYKYNIECLRHACDGIN